MELSTSWSVIVGYTQTQGLVLLHCFFIACSSCSVQCLAAVVLVLGLKRYDRAPCLRVNAVVVHRLPTAHPNSQSNVKLVVRLIARLLWGTKVCVSVCLCLW